MAPRGRLYTYLSRNYLNYYLTLFYYKIHYSQEMKTSRIYCDNLPVINYGVQGKRLVSTDYDLIGTRKEKDMPESMVQWLCILPPWDASLSTLGLAFWKELRCVKQSINLLILSVILHFEQLFMLFGKENMTLTTLRLWSEFIRACCQSVNVAMLLCD